jgi:hypothetical protein
MSHDLALLASNFESARLQYEHELIGAMLADPHRGYATATRRGVHDGLFLHDGLRLIFNAMQALAMRGQLCADVLECRIRVMLLVRDGLVVCRVRWWGAARDWLALFDSYPRGETTLRIVETQAFKLIEGNDRVSRARQKYREVMDLLTVEAR